MNTCREWILLPAYRGLISSASHREVFFYAGWLFSITIANSLQYLINTARKLITNGKITLITAAITIFLILLSSGLYVIKIITVVECLWTVVGSLVICILVLIKMKKWVNDNFWMGCIAVFLVCDLSGVSGLGLKTISLDRELNNNREIIQLLKQVDEPFRIYSPSYSLSQITGVNNHLEYANGINPLQLNKYVTYMAEATGVRKSGYSVTLPPFETGDPKVDNQRAVPDLRKLGLLNVKFIVSEFPIVMEGLVEKETINSSYLYENLLVMPRAWVQGQEIKTGSEYRGVNKITHTANEIFITASGPGRLVLSEIYYPGWKVYVDGFEKQIVSVDGILRGVDLDDKTHEIRFSFQPLFLFAGLIVSFITIIFLGIKTLVRKRNLV